ncbi:hypothetical protein [Cylindrospermopsis curvispora]|uniref:Outer membrane beta-barrel protein n=1 Tax=Cylindrospermopsis curvispora GIHE-G1 TaxID=2666332 RepID=A0A7H0F5V8_9CYAN|nr:hypothetical protein [Cylindrospermopsis curvispora]MBU6346838.1 hypothetical protein [Cyanobacteria bacterium REEB494]QNP31424.1 hypothetical protein IAR63_17700 [Cylindrospermopsis curvispora GIHE-G1]
MKHFFWFSILLTVFNLQPGFSQTITKEKEKPLILRSIWLSGGGNEKTFTGAVGLRRDWFGFEIGVASFSNMPTTEKFNIPHNSYTSIGERETSKLGIDLLGFLPISQDLFLYGGPGFYFAERANIIRSNATGWLYRKDSFTSTDFTGQAGINYTRSNFTMGVSYHGLRGANIHIGWAINALD